VKKSEAFFIPGLPYWGGSLGKDDQSAYGHLSAIDPTTGATRWRHTDTSLMLGGTLATGGGLVFSGNQSGYTMAFDDRTGEPLWKFHVGAPVRGQPITYKVDGRQYVAVPSGDRSQPEAEAQRDAPADQENTLTVFSLSE
jgi:alcohol dehydrogenase (cytochrome c)